ncbi:MAG TPA: hypothetical protein VHY91_27045 [Pirellulales bacterium]|jgi:hypothetical protein|nr:hypothetical protein [Pirellulales bacterium]
MILSDDSMCNYIESMNRPVLELDDAHPAKRFLTAFMDCRMNCSERELDIGDQVPIDQTWTSATDGRTWTFSGFIYSVICFDIVLDGFLQGVPYPTESETASAQEVPRLRLMMNECAQAARQCGNNEILDLTDQVQGMFNLWEEYLDYRKGMITRGRE